MMSQAVQYFDPSSAGGKEEVRTMQDIPVLKMDKVQSEGHGGRQGGRGCSGSEAIVGAGTGRRCSH